MDRSPPRHRRTRFAGWAILATLALFQPGAAPGMFAATAVSARQIDTVSASPLINALPPDVAAKVRMGVNHQDLTPYLNRALAHGGAFDLGGFTYRIAGRLLPGPDTHLTGTGTFLAASDFDDHSQHDGLQMMIRIANDLRVDNGIIFDGGSIRRPGFWLTGARNTGPVTNVVLNAAFRNLSFDGIDISRNNGAWRNANISTGARIENVGWIGANLEGIDGLIHDDLRVARTGFHGIYVGYSHAVRGARFSVDKSHAPYRIYDGPGGFGGVEKGFLFGHFSTIGARWTDFHLYDNRHAGYDGFGIGEDGPMADPESRDIFAQGEVWYAGLFGFDVSSDMIADVTIHYPARQGIQFGLDLGGTLSNIRVKARVEGNYADESARFSATGSAKRNVVMRAGSTELTIVGNGDFTVVPGQAASGDGVAPGSKVIAVDGQRVTLDRPATLTHTLARPVQITFRANISFDNCELDLKATNTSYGLGVQSDSDGFTHYRNVRVSGDLTPATKAGVRALNGRLPGGMTISARRN